MPTGFPYTTDFISESLEIKQTIRATRSLLPEYRLRFVTDAGLDDQKLFAELYSTALKSNKILCGFVLFYDAVEYS
ncbi:MAG: hypothetical protein JXM69_05700 [Anaerolineae bacterium]|nr:hypothetical protein [Anaerolineae bacterium]